MILVENILKKYNAIGINIAKFMIKWMRSNHAGETGAVKATEFIGDGSKLTNLPGGGGTPDLDAVLKEGNTADEQIIVAGFSTPFNAEYNGINDDESKYRVFAYPNIGLRIDKPEDVEPVIEDRLKLPSPSSSE
mgnify:CR=1 FL=1